MNVSKMGIEIPILSAPGIPLEPFELKREAITYAEAHPDLIKHGTFTVKSILILQEEEVTAANTELTSSIEE